MALTRQAVSVRNPYSSLPNWLYPTFVVGGLIILLLGAIPAWPHSRSWGYGPTGGLGLLVVIVIILLLLRVF